MTTKQVPVYERLTKANDFIADENSRRFNEFNVYVCGLISSPGAGKTTLLERTIEKLQARGFSCAVLVGDIATTRDAERLHKFNIPAMQLTTGGGCHLEAQQVSRAIEDLDLEKIDYLFIENVGNLVCPSSYVLGEDIRVVMLSVPEGDDKVEKYPTTFRRADVVMLNKIDLLQHLPFDRDKVLREMRTLNSEAVVLELSAANGDGLEQWLDLLEKNKAAKG